ncbi:10208_t:CDS:2 [Ambispora gerdemannii]|uniref:10208_t:CDS:1 n=1 Tax=Ambispora gerdemannii TaxID=144530 RepID=A0A9N9GUE0_9GLOM|nr:10208_t:CDS:2 [Ambispora gerdemannii]
MKSILAFLFIAFSADYGIRNFTVNNVSIFVEICGKPTDPSQYTLDYNAQNLKAVVDAVVNRGLGKKINLAGWSMIAATATTLFVSRKFWTK